MILIETHCVFPEQSFRIRPANISIKKWRQSWFKNWNKFMNEYWNQPWTANLDWYGNLLVEIYAAFRRLSSANLINFRLLIFEWIKMGQNQTIYSKCNRTQFNTDHKIINRWPVARWIGIQQYQQNIFQNIDRKQYFGGSPIQQRIKHICLLTLIKYENMIQTM